MVQQRLGNKHETSSQQPRQVHTGTNKKTEKLVMQKLHRHQRDSRHYANDTNETGGHAHQAASSIQTCKSHTHSIDSSTRHWPGLNTTQAQAQKTRREFIGHTN